eukprot:6586701-Prymnesium_polylepis.1
MRSTAGVGRISCVSPRTSHCQVDAPGRCVDCLDWRDAWGVHRAWRARHGRWAGARKCAARLTQSAEH